MVIKLDEILNEQRNYFQDGRTLDVEFRIEKLRILKSAIVNYKEKIVDALYKDLRKNEFEAYTTEIIPVLEDLNLAIKNVKKWAENENVRTPMYLSGVQGGIESFIMKEPLGNILIISPFNYPFQLSIVPMIGAIAAGNTVILKPSSDTIHTTKILMEMINSIFAREYVYVLNPKNTLHFELLNKKFDHIFFTGSIQTGKKIMEAASKNLTPVTLELGGKSPAVVDKTCNIKNAARSIIWGKLLNAGQTCVAPDYVLVHEDIKEYFIEELKISIKEYLGPLPQENENFGRIINERQFAKLKEIIEIEYENLIYGGQFDECGLYVEPTLLDIKSFESFAMQNEIFGPILPILTFENTFDIIKTIKKLEKPLAAYIFSNDSLVISEFLTKFSYGGGCVNETMMHLANNNLPFGGVGLSGIGQYHGKYTFDTFTHKKSILKKKGDRVDKSKMPPDFKERLNSIKRIVKLLEF